MTALNDSLVRIDRAETEGDRARLSDTQAATLDRASLRLMKGDSTATAAISSILDRTLRLPFYRLDAALAEVSKLAAKARKRNLPEPLMSELSRETIGEGDEAEEWATVRLLGAAPVLQGWSVAAALSILHMPDKDPIVSCYVADGAAVDAAAYTEHATTCGHCHTNRRRNLTYVLSHVDGRCMQVGSTCVNEYLGTEALTAWFVFSRLHALESDLRGWGTFDRADYYAWLAEQAAKTGHAHTRSGERREVDVPLRDFLACTAADMRERDGYINRATSRAKNVQTTGESVWSGYQDATHSAPTEADFAEADGCLAWLDSDVRGTEEYGAYDDEPTYLTSLARALADCEKIGGVGKYKVGYMASAIPAYRRELARREEAKTIRDEHVPLCEAGDRIVLDSLTVQRVLNWGISCFDSERRVVFVQTTHYADGNPVQCGDMIRVAGIVRDLTFYQSIAQTRLNRAKVRPTGEDHTTTEAKNMHKWAKDRGFPCPEWAAKKSSKR